MIINPQLRKEIEESIAECEACVDIEEANYLYNKLIAKYTTIDPNFALGLPARGKLVSLDGEKDSRPVIPAIKAKLEMILISAETPLSLKTQKILDKNDEFIREGIAIYNDYFSDEGNLIISDVIEGPRFDKWILGLEVFSNKELATHPLHQRMQPFFGKHNMSPSTFSQILNCLNVIAEDVVFFNEIEADEQLSRTGDTKTISMPITTSKNEKKFF